VSHINEFCAHYESMGLIATVFHEPDSRGLVPGIHVVAACPQERRGWPYNKPGHDEKRIIFKWLERA
jgi:hypothetical protein